MGLVDKIPFYRKIPADINRKRSDFWKIFPEILVESLKPSIYQVVICILIRDTGRKGVQQPGDISTNRIHS